MEAVPGDITTIKEDLASVNNLLSSLEPRICESEKRIEALEQELGVLKNQSINSSGLDSGSLEVTLAELHERTRRSSNVMVFNLEESPSADVAVRKQHDMDFISKLFSPFLPSFSPVGARSLRVGKKKQGYTRPLKVILGNPADASTVISKFNAELCDPLLSKVRLSRDRTPFEANHLKTLNAELANRKSRGEEGLTIKYISGVPKIVSNKQKNA
ncbi:uncharacterized protein LOC120355956 [Nilaparvata lugens]|uniref:uncharacterized protein LOC120355956 n=1 Tax=Nilaparvata lugens TaxID=108931 RepID=UPI00193CC26A|nr:uncharacterized protein LOC120355956 [Nilaparvata lugens]